MPHPTAAILVIGDEILSGRTRDTNSGHLAARLTECGIRLGEVRVVADVEAAIISAVHALSPAYDTLFTCGGIGPTHDDITAQAVARAFNTPISVRDDARAILQAYYDARGTPLNEARLRMARIPDGATLIDNPISAAPGFVLGNVCVMAGVPRIFEAMVEAVLPGLVQGEPLVSETLRTMRGEGDIADILSDVAARHEGLSFGSYPFLHEGHQGTNLVIRGFDGAQVRAALADLREALGL